MFDELLRYLNIEWADDNLKEDIKRMLVRGKDYLKWITNADIDYKEDTFAKDLLFDYVRYSMSQAVDEYPSNYENLLLALSMKYTPIFSDSEEGEDID